MSTLLFYQSGNKGRPSIRSFGINILIKRELHENRKVEIYIIPSTKVEGIIKGLCGRRKGMIASFKEMENECKKEYKETMNTYPDWILPGIGQEMG